MTQPCSALRSRANISWHRKLSDLPTSTCASWLVILSKHHSFPLKRSSNCWVYSTPPRHVENVVKSRGAARLGALSHENSEDQCSGNARVDLALESPRST